MDRGRKMMLTPQKHRQLTLIILISVGSSFGLELSTKFLRLGGRTTESISFLAVIVLSLSCVYLVFQAGKIPRVRLTGILGAAFLISSQVLNVCDELRSLDLVPLLGARSPLHDPAKQILLVGGFALLVLSFYSSLVETIESRGHLAREQEGLVREMRERSLVEQALRESEARFSGILDIAHEAIISIDEDHRIIMFNKSAEQVLGYSAAEVLGKPVGILVPERFRPTHGKHLRDFAASPSAARLIGERSPIYGRRKDGTEFPAEASISQLELPKQKVLTAVLRDITARKQAEESLRNANTELERNEAMLRDALSKLRASHEQLKATQLQLLQAEKMKMVGQLAAGVAHEVKNPLAVILMGLEYLKTCLAGADPNAKSVIKDLDYAVRKADAVVRGLLDFSASRQVDMRLEDLNSVVEQSLLLVKYEMEKCRVTLAKDLTSGLPLLELDKNKLEQALVNILMNAIQAMPEGGTLTVRTHARIIPSRPVEALAGGAGPAVGNGLVALLEIQDTGHGIPEDKLHRIYDPFFSTKPSGKGSGLGLTVTRTIIELHGGSIDIRNRPEGGAEARIRFPARAPAGPAREPAAPPITR